MKIPEFGTLQMARSEEAHYGSSKITSNASGAISSVRIDTGLTNAAGDAAEKTRVSFDNYLIDAVNKMNDQQMNVADIERKLITEPESVDIHDVTVAMAKARMSLNLAKTVIDRLVQGWSEITTTR
ncbi:MAG: flagellar hook-basal body complex protein FliE [Treponema sp.]